MQQGQKPVMGVCPLNPKVDVEHSEKVIGMWPMFVINPNCELPHSHQEHENSRKLN